MRVAVLVTGGKDSALALYRAMKEGHKVKYLVTMIPQREDSWMFHFPNIRLTDLFADAVGIPLVKAETRGIKEEEVRDLKRLLSTLNVEGIVSGAVSSEYQKSRIETVCRDLKMKSLTPLWHEEPLKIMEELIDLRFNVIIVGVYAYGFDRSWLGRQLNSETLNDLIELNRRYQISLVGEGGEYETFVLDTPYFRKRIQITASEEIWDDDSGHLFVKRAKLVKK